MSSAPFLSLDLGLRRTGVSVSESGLIARPLTTLEWEPHERVAHCQEIARLVAEFGVATLVVGMPLEEDGSTTGQSEKTETVLVTLREVLAEKKLSPELAIVNEYHSTQDGLAEYPGVDKDAAAATLLLQDFLDQTNPS